MISSMDFVNLDAAESLIGDLLSAISARRVYGPDHARTGDAIRRFCAELRRYESSSPDQIFSFRAEAGLITHQGYPLEGSNRLIQVATILSGRNCGGLTFGPGVNESALEELLAVLADDGELPARAGAIELRPGNAEDSDLDDLDFALAPEFRVPTRIYRNTAKSLEVLMNRVRSGEAIDLTQVTDLVECVVEEVTASGTRILGPVQMTQWDSYTFQHSVNVFMISTALLQPFARSREELLAMAQAALLHDIGKSRIPTAILHKKGKLTEKETAIVRQHPVAGAQILLELGGIDPLAVEVAYCHHMHDDGLGYPNARLPIAPGPVTRIVQVADMFEALTAARPYKPGLPVREAIDVLHRMPGMKSKKPALELLMARLTESPPGSEVVLTTGEHARVVHAHPEQPDLPLVRLLTDGGGAPLEGQPLVDLRQEPERRIADVILRPMQESATAPQ